MLLRGGEGRGGDEGTVVRAAFLVGLVSCYVEDFALISGECQPQPLRMWTGESGSGEVEAGSTACAKHTLIAT